MLRQLSVLFGSMALAAALSPAATAQEYSNGPKKKYGPAILTPVEAYGVKPPGVNCDCPKGVYIPYYAPLSPTPTCKRYAPWCYWPLMPYYTPYYCGYSPKRLCNPKPLPYGFDGGWGPGPGPDGPGGPNFNYGPFTSVLKDDTTFWRMGGNGLVPYGTPPPPRTTPPDIVDMIQVSRQHGGCLAPAAGGPGPAILPPTETPADKGGAVDKEDKAEPPAEKLMPPK